MQIKQEAMRMLGQLHEVEAKRDQLLAEDARHEDPQVERERLLAQVKDDNRETANMDREWVSTSLNLTTLPSPGK